MSWKKKEYLGCKKITKKIEDKRVTNQDLIELAEIYNKYIIWEENFETDWPFFANYL